MFIPVQLDAEIDEAAIKISKELVQTVDSAFDLVDKLLEVIQIPIIYFLFISTAVNSLDWTIRMAKKLSMNNWTIVNKRP